MIQGTILRALRASVCLILILAFVFPPRHVIAEMSGSEEAAIEQYRKGSVTLKIIDDRGNPVPNAFVEYKQTTHDFLFGVGTTTANPPGYYPDETYRFLKEAGINHALPYLTWNLTSNPDWIEEAYKPAVLRNMGFTLTAHCLYWMCPRADWWNLPTAVKSMTYEELKVALYSHTYEVVLKYKPYITYWGINEPFWRDADVFNFDASQWIETIKITIRAIKDAHPEGKILINNLMGDWPKQHYYPLQIIKLLIDEGIEFDVIGLELYGHRQTPGVRLDSRGYPEISWVSRRLDEFRKFGKSIILSEIGVKNRPNEMNQASWLLSVYTMAFSKPYVLGVVWLFISDDPFLPGAGMLNKDLSPRLVFYALRNLIGNWTTSGNGRSDSSGQLLFRGFGRNYSIAISGSGYKPLKAIIHVAETEDLEYAFRLETSEKAETRTQSATMSPVKPTTVTSNYLALIAIAISIIAATTFALQRKHIRN